jgi:hypothetical protein
MFSFSGGEILLYYLVCFVGPVFNLGGWFFNGTHSVAVQLFLTVESATLFVLWVEPFFMWPRLSFWMRYLLYLEVILLFSRGLMWTFVTG